MYKDMEWLEQNNENGIDKKKADIRKDHVVIELTMKGIKEIYGSIILPQASQTSSNSLCGGSTVAYDKSPARTAKSNGFAALSFSICSATAKPIYLKGRIIEFINRLVIRRVGLKKRYNGELQRLSVIRRVV